MDKIKTCLITGASSGIGKELSYLFAQDNYTLVLIARNKQNLEKLKKELQEKYKVEVYLILQDLNEKNASNLIYEKVLNLNLEISVLVNNAGFGYYGEFSKISYNIIQSMMQVNINSLVDLCYKFLPIMKKNKYGKILNVSSVAGFQPCPFFAIYASSKAFVLNFSEALNQEYKKYNIRVSTLAPGPTKTNFFNNTGLTDTSFLDKKNLTMDAKKVALIAYKKFFKNKEVIVTGFKNKLSIFIIRFVPRKVVAQVSKYLLLKVRK